MIILRKHPFLNPLQYIYDNIYIIKKKWKTNISIKKYK